VRWKRSRGREKGKIGEGRDVITRKGRPGTLDIHSEKVREIPTEGRVYVEDHKEAAAMTPGGLPGGGAEIRVSWKLAAKTEGLGK